MSAAPDTTMTMLSWGLIAAALLAVLALLIGLTVLLTFRGVTVPTASVRQYARVCAWIIPAILLLGFVAVSRVHELGEMSQSATIVYADHEHGPEPPAVAAEPRVAPPQMIPEQLAGTTVSAGEHEVDPNAPVTTVAPVNVSPVNVAPVIVSAPTGAPTNPPPMATPALNGIGAQRAGYPPETEMPPVLHLPPGSVTLKVRQTLSDPPAWVSAAPQQVGDATRVAISSGLWSSPAEAEEDATLRVLGAVQNHFHNEFPNQGPWQLSLATIESLGAVREVVAVSSERDFGSVRSRMYRVHAQLDLSPKLRQAVYESWRGQVIERRLWVIGSLLGLVTLMLATAAFYFKLDDVSFGMYRGRLKVAALALIAAGTLIVIRLV